MEWKKMQKDGKHTHTESVNREEEEKPNDFIHN